MPFEGQTLQEIIAKTHPKATFIENDNNLIRRATEGSDKSPQAIEKKIENLMVARKMIKTETKLIYLCRWPS